MSDFIDALNLITSEKIYELYKKQDTEDPLVLRKKVWSLDVPYCSSSKRQHHVANSFYPTYKRARCVVLTLTGDG